MPFQFTKTRIPDVIIVKPKVFEDERGYFMETYKKRDFEEAGITAGFVQDNHSYSKKNVLRGLHFQRPPHAQAKLVRCTRGAVYDVAVDIRRSSPTYGQWVAVILSETNKWMLYVPRGFAHGFLTLTGEAEVQYKVDNYYAPQAESGITWSDPDLAIPWPTDNPALSEKDKKWPTLKQLEQNNQVFD